MEKMQVRREEGGEERVGERMMDMKGGACQYIFSRGESGMEAVRTWG